MPMKSIISYLSTAFFSGIDRKSKSQAEKEMNDFFELTIQQGFTQLELFASQLKLAMQRG